MTCDLSDKALVVFLPNVSLLGVEVNAKKPLKLKPGFYKIFYVSQVNFNNHNICIRDVNLGIKPPFNKWVCIREFV